MIHSSSLTALKVVIAQTSSSTLSFLNKHLIAGFVLTFLAPVGVTAQTVTVRHWDTHSRSGLRLNVALSGQNSTDALVVTLNGAVAYTKTGNLQSTEFAPVPFGTLAAGTYPMVTQLKASDGTVRASHSENITLHNRGSVTIDANNNILVNGKPHFFMTMWMWYASDYLTWYGNGELTNYGWTGDYNANGYSTSQWVNQINQVIASSPGGVIGPGGRSSGTVASYTGNSSISNQTAVWYWTDEPDLHYSDSGTTPAYMTQQWNDTHNNDTTNQRPLITDFYGYAPDITIQGQGYTYPTIMTDIVSFDLYPVIQSQKGNPAYGTCPAYWSNGDMGSCIVTFTGWESVYRTIDAYNYRTVPMWPIIEWGSEQNYNGPNNNQFRMELWLAVINGAKSISLWNTLGIVPDANHAELKTFESKMNRGVANCVLGAPSSHTVATNQNAAPGTTDNIVRATVCEDSSNIWVIAQRLSDDIQIPAAATNPPLSTQITVSGISASNTATVFDESRTLAVSSSGVFTDSFAPYATHIYQIPKSASSSTVAPPTGLKAVVQ